MLDGQIGQDILAKFPAKGLVAISWMENGFRHVTNSKKAIVTPEDLKGLKIRTMENKAAHGSLQGDGFAADADEHERGVHRAADRYRRWSGKTRFRLILANKLYTVQKYLSLTSHVYSPAILILNKGLWDKLRRRRQKGLVQGSRQDRAGRQPQESQ